MAKQVERVGCCKIGSKVFVGSSMKVREISGFEIGEGSNAGQVFASIKGGVVRDIRKLSLAGPNGDGIGAQALQTSNGGALMSAQNVHFLFRLEEAPDPLTIPAPPVCQDCAAVEDGRQLSLQLETERDAVRAWRAVEA